MAEPTPPSNTPAEPSPQPAGRKRRRRWPWIVLGLLLLLIVLLILLLPTIASTPPVRSLVVAQINDNLNGKATIDDWSLGWTGGIRVSGVKVYDDQSRLILEMAKLQTGLSLLDLIQGNLALGETTIDGLNLTQLVIDENGQTNYQKLVKSSPQEQAPPTPETEKGHPAELPNITGNIHINDLRGTIVMAGAPKPIFIEPSTVAVAITDINQPISDDVNLALRVGDNPPGTIKLSGQADIAEAGKLALEQLSANQKLSIASLDFAAAGPFLQMAGVDLSLAGVANGALDINVAGTTDGQTSGQIVVENFAAGGAALNGDRFETAKLSIPVQVAVSTADPNRTILRIEKLGVVMPEGTVAVTGNVTQQALARLADQQAPGEQGNIRVAAQVPGLAKVVNQLRNTLHLVEGAQLTSGDLSATVDVTLSDERAVVAQSLDLKAAGTNDGQPITLEPIHLEANAALLPGTGEVPNLRDLALLLTSKFAEVRASADTLAAANAKGTFDLEALQRQIGQFVDFGDIDLAGTGQFAVATQGDVLQGDQPITGNVTAQVANLRVIGATPDLNVALAKMAIDATGTYSGGTTKLDQPATVSLQQVTLKKPSGQTILNDENIDVAIAGIVNSSPQDTGANLSTLSVTTGSDLLRVQVPQGQRLQLQVGENGSFQGDGTLAIGADLARLSQIGQSFAGPAPATQPGESIDQIESGRLDGTIHFARADRQPMTNVVGDFNITNLTMGEYLQNEKIAIGVRAEAPDALDSLQASANVNSSFAKIDVADARLLLTTQSGNEARAASVWEMIQHATVNVDAPNLEKVYALVGSAMPAATQPVETLAGGDEGQAASLPPLRLTKGAATAKVEIARESATTKLDVSELRATGVVLRRGDNRWALPRDRAIDLALAANLETSGQDISAINVTQLNGDLGVARLAMSQPISIQNPAGNFAASGAFELTGALGDLAPLLKTLQGSEFPYRGEYVVRQTLATQGDLVKLAGAINASGFKVLDGADVIFSEEQLAIDNDVSVDPGKQIANISKLTLAMKSSNAVNLAANGTINDWDDRRQFKDVTINLSYDLAELWKIIYPMLAPETQESLKTLQVAGQDKTQFTIFGSFPGSQPTNEAIQSLDVQGGFPIELIDYDGIHIGDLNPTFRLRGGVFRFTKDVVASFNGGKLDLSRIEADLRQDEPRVTFAKNHPLVRSATINPLLGKTIGQYVNPVFANATRARGQLDVTIDYCENLALSETIKTKDSGRMKASFALLDMDIANPLGSLVLGKLAELPLVGSAIQPQGLDVFSGSIRRAVVTVENGQTTQDITMEIIDPKAAERAQQVVGSEKPAVPVYPLRFQGDVNLSSLAQSLTMTIPPGLLDKWGGSDLLKVFPNGLPLSLGGTTLAPEVKLGDIGQAILKGQLQQNIGGGGGDAGKNALEDLLNKTLGGKDEKSAEPKPPGGAGAGEESRSADEPDEKRAGRAEEKPREKSRQQRDNAERP